MAFGYIHTAGATKFPEWNCWSKSRKACCGKTSDNKQLLFISITHSTIDVIQPFPITQLWDCCLGSANMIWFYAGTCVRIMHPVKKRDPFSGYNIMSVLNVKFCAYSPYDHVLFGLQYVNQTDAENGNSLVPYQLRILTISLIVYTGNLTWIPLSIPYFCL